MAAIDKIYLNNWEQYIQFKEWCEKQPSLKDKYGVSCRLTDYVYSYGIPFEGTHAVFRAPYYLDAYLIKNCPFDFIQEELMLNYGYWSQKRIKNYYDDIKNWSGKDEYPYWAKLEDFTFNEDGTITLNGLEKSSYELIKEGKLYNTPFSQQKFTVGKHIKCIKHPHIKYNRPSIGHWLIDIDIPRELGYMWYHSNHNSWDFSDEFVMCDWSSSTAYSKTIKAAKRLLRKWKLPIGTKVRILGHCVNEQYEFIITL